MKQHVNMCTAPKELGRGKLWCNCGQVQEVGVAPHQAALCHQLTRHDLAQTPVWALNQAFNQAITQRDGAPAAPTMQPVDAPLAPHCAGCVELEQGYHIRWRHAEPFVAASPVDTAFDLKAQSVY
jgi:hypothetical protein